MPEPTTRTRLQLARLDDRTVPSTVTATTTARPFDFVADGTLTTTAPGTDGTTPVTATATTTVHLTGSINYTDNATGSTGQVGISGTGTGTQTPTNPGDTGGRGAFSQTLQGQLAFQDANGAVNTTTPLTGTENWISPGGGAGIDLLGPQDFTGTFDTSTFQLQASWGATAGPTGTLTVTLANAKNVATDLAFGQQSASLAADGSVVLDFSALVTGNLITAPSHAAAIAHVTAEWEGDGGQTQAADLDVPIDWNTGQVVVHAADLTAPSWAKTLTVTLDAANQVTEGDELNNTWTVTLADLRTTSPPPPAGGVDGSSPPVSPPSVDGGGGDTSPPVSPPPPADGGSGFPRVPSTTTRVTASYTLVPVPVPQVQWRDAEGVVLASADAFDTFTGPINMATGDVNGDGVPDAVISAGDGGGPRVRVLDGKSGAELLNFFAYDSGFRGGVNIALGDVNGDGKLDLVTGAGDGGGPHARVFDLPTGQLVSEFFADGTNGRGGARVATADLDGDGTAEVITTEGPGGGASLFVFDAGGNERFSAPVAAPGYSGGVALTAVTNPTSHVVVVTATPEASGSAVRFLNQLAAGGPLLVEQNDALPEGAVVVG
jgi:hypothetical protein